MQPRLHKNVIEIHELVCDESIPLLTESQLPPAFSTVAPPNASINDGAFQALSADLIRLIASMLPLCDAVHFSHTNSRIHEIIINAFRMRETRDEQSGAVQQTPFLARDDDGAPCTYVQIFLHLNAQRRVQTRVNSIRNDAINNNLPVVGAVIMGGDRPCYGYFMLSSCVTMALLVTSMVPTAILVKKEIIGQYLGNNILIPVEAAISLVGGGITGLLFYKRSRRMAARQAILQLELDNTLPDAMDAPKRN